MKLLVVAVISPGGAALAQTPKVQYEKKTIIDLSGDTIEGDLTNPDAEYIASRKTVRHLSMIKARKDS